MRSGKIGKAVCAFLGIVFAGAMLTCVPASAQEEAYEKAIQAYLKKDFQGAARLLREYVEKRPDAVAYYLLGYANYKLKNRQEAAENFRAAYLIDPDFSPKSIDFKKERR